MLEIKKNGQYAGHADCIYALKKSINPHHFYTGAADGYIVEWNEDAAVDGKLISRVSRPVYSLFVNEELKQLYAGTAQGNLHIIDLNKAAETRNIEAHTLGLFDIKVIQNKLITAGGDGIINFWEKDSLQLITSINASDKSARTIAIHPNETEFAVGFSDHSIKIFDAINYTLKQTLQAHTNSVFALSYSPDGKYLLSGGRDVMLKAWRFDSAQQPIRSLSGAKIPFLSVNNYILEHDIAAHTLHINSIEFNSSGKLFATASMDKTIKIWDAQSFKLLKVIDKARNLSHATSVNKIMWLDENKLLSISDDKLAMMWEIKPL